MMYAYSDMECDRDNFLTFFALSPQYWTQKLKFGKNEKKTGDIILLHMCAINQGHMVYGSWDIRHIV